MAEQGHKYLGGTLHVPGTVLSTKEAKTSKKDSHCLQAAYVLMGEDKYLDLVI